MFDVEILRGPLAPEGARPDLLVEVPHGADTRAHYDAVRERLVGDLPADLHEFFHLNTDTGAWALGRAVAAEVVRLRPSTVAKVIRCHVPRTFIDCNRLESADASSGMTAGLAPYVDDPRDVAFLLGLHRAYVSAVSAAFDEVVGGGGVALVPHTYGPVTLDIPAIDRNIVAVLREAHEREWPLRPEVDVLSRDVDGALLGPQGAAEAVRAALPGVEVAECATYSLHPATLGHRWSARWPGRVLSFEVRRDLLVREWRWNAEMTVEADKVARFAGPLGALVARWLDARP